MGIRRLAALAPLTALAVGALVWFAAGDALDAQDLLPTPKGQLGGAPSLQTEPPRAEETPPPTPDEDDEDDDIPDPSECEIRPRTIDELLNLAATPVTATDPVAAATPGAVPNGQPADAIIANAVAYTVREAVACANAGEALRLLSLFSDGYLQRTAARLGGFDEQFLRSLAAPQPTRRDEMPQVTDVVLFPDGRAAAWVVPDEEEAVFALSSLEGRLWVVFVAVEGRWLVDEVHVPGYS